MPENEIAHVKVTINDLYKEQQETNKLLIQLASELKGMSDLPLRVHTIETKLAAGEWVGKVVWAALMSGIIGFGTSLYSLITKG